MLIAQNSPYPLEDEDMDAIYEDDHNEFIETDLDHMWLSRENSPNVPIPDGLDESIPATPLMSVDESEYEANLTPSGAEVKSFERKGHTWTKQPSQGILYNHRATTPRGAGGSASVIEEVSVRTPPASRPSARLVANTASLTARAAKRDDQVPPSDHPQASVDDI